MQDEVESTLAPISAGLAETSKDQVRTFCLQPNDKSFRTKLTNGDQPKADMFVSSVDALDMLQATGERGKLFLMFIEPPIKRQSRSRRRLSTKQTSFSDPVLVKFEAELQYAAIGFYHDIADSVNL